MQLKLGFSPCPNDTFIFHAMIHHKVDTEDLTFEVFYDDVETLNRKTFLGEPDISKLSFHAYAYAVEEYVLLDAGSALGFGVGPLLIAKDAAFAQPLFALAGLESLADQGEQLKNLKIGFPGKYTTANFLLNIAFPFLKNKEEMLFSKIEPSLLEGKIDLGLIIHENRFTYLEKGLHKVIDLGDFWEQKTNSPIPLGGIVIKRALPNGIKQKVNRVIRRSVEYAFEHPNAGMDFIRSHAQEMNEDVMYKHIDLYVNKFSIDLGEEGKNAVQNLFDIAYLRKLIPETTQELFLD